MSLFFKRTLPAALLLMSTLVSGTSFAYAPDPTLLETKGYSPQTIDAIYTQSKRMEWKDPPAPEMTPTERFFRNVYINDWTGNFDEFGSHIIRERQ